MGRISAYLHYLVVQQLAHAYLLGVIKKMGGAYIRTDVALRTWPIYYYPARWYAISEDNYIPSVRMTACCDTC